MTPTTEAGRALHRLWHDEMDEPGYACTASCMVRSLALAIGAEAAAQAVADYAEQKRREVEALAFWDADDKAAVLALLAVPDKAGALTAALRETGE